LVNLQNSPAAVYEPFLEAWDKYEDRNK
jgi:hypothetical protein